MLNYSFTITGNLPVDKFHIALYDLLCTDYETQEWHW